MNLDKSGRLLITHRNSKILHDEFQKHSHFILFSGFNCLFNFLEFCVVRILLEFCSVCMQYATNLLNLIFIVLLIYFTLIILMYFVFKVSFFYGISIQNWIDNDVC